MLLNLSCSLDALGPSVNAFYAGFYTEAERMDTSRWQLRTAVTDPGLGVDPAAGESAKVQFPRRLKTQGQAAKTPWRQACWQ